MPSRKPRDQPIEVIAEEGEVIIEGPPHMVTSMTPEAAEESSNRLYECCAKARGQQIMKPISLARTRGGRTEGT